MVGSIPDAVTEFFKAPNSSSSVMVLGLAQPLKEISTSNLPVGKGRPVRKPDNLTVIYEPIMLEPRRLTALSTSTACYKDCYN
jgi:hypothetical protein